MQMLKSVRSFILIPPLSLDLHSLSHFTHIFFIKKDGRLTLIKSFNDDDLRRNVEDLMMILGEMLKT